MKIRKALPEDAMGVAKVQVDSWRTTYKGIVSEDFLRQLSYEKRKSVIEKAITEKITYVAEEDGEIIGFISGGKKRLEQYEGYDGELYAIYLLQQYQKRGIGKELVNMLAKDFLKMGFKGMIVLVLEENPSKYFYESLGGVRIGKEITMIGKQRLHSFVYGWKNLSVLL
ncbi:GNAT family N-acetyltransferase [Fervidibacillus halotolerans]|uniref:GNAT family N-acetyltransferase n=1 Tax=Fervidibacillus halotolerans TaxID=2980027 RepID=A0A9E8M0I5_9BACI|nr:GNAT family N-acetyltransferase [Fervidibacillus halotolerans]WAA13165.1 GNAT family N-acetyltransferase [Fervidibacillus halotolerans]